MTTDKQLLEFNKLIELFGQTQTAMQTRAAKSVDIALVVRNWLFGWYIIEFEQHDADRAQLYGKALIQKLSLKLSNKLGKGFSKRSLEQFRKFYLEYQKITQTLSAQSFKGNDESPVKALSVGLAGDDISIFKGKKYEEICQALSVEFKLSWSHYVVLLTVKALDKRKFYEIEAIDNSWGIRELKRQIASSLYERLAISRDKNEIQELAEKGQIVQEPKDILKSPYVLEFLELEESLAYSEHELETAIISQQKSIRTQYGLER